MPSTDWVLVVGVRGTAYIHGWAPRQTPEVGASARLAMGFESFRHAQDFLLSRVHEYGWVRGPLLGTIRPAKRTITPLPARQEWQRIDGAFDPSDPDVRIRIEGLTISFDSLKDLAQWFPAGSIRGEVYPSRLVNLPASTEVKVDLVGE